MLEDERARYEGASVDKPRPPEPPSWPELDDLRALAQAYPEVCKLSPGVSNLGFLETLKEEQGLSLPEELIALYAAHDGIELAYDGSAVPIFTFVESDAIYAEDAIDGYPTRAVVFTGDDEEKLSVYRDAHNVWWLVFEYEDEPVGKTQLNIRQLLAHAYKRVDPDRPTDAPPELSWNTFFGLPS